MGDELEEGELPESPNKRTKTGVAYLALSGHGARQIWPGQQPLVRNRLFCYEWNV